MCVCVCVSVATCGRLPARLLVCAGNMMCSWAGVRFRESLRLCLCPSGCARLFARVGENIVLSGAYCRRARADVRVRRVTVCVCVSACILVWG